MRTVSTSGLDSRGAMRASRRSFDPSQPATGRYVRRAKRDPEYNEYASPAQFQSIFHLETDFRPRRGGVFGPVRCRRLSVGELTNGVGVDISAAPPAGWFGRASCSCDAAAAGVFGSWRRVGS